MSNFKPQVSVMSNQSRRDACNSYGKRSIYQTIRYETYRELKKHLKEHLQESLEDTICVIRSKRGEWGEYCETWALNDDGKPIIVKETWM